MKTPSEIFEIFPISNSPAVSYKKGYTFYRICQAQTSSLLLLRFMDSLQLLPCCFAVRAVLAFRSDGRNGISIQQLLYLRQALIYPVCLPFAGHESEFELQLRIECFLV